MNQIQLSFEDDLYLVYFTSLLLINGYVTGNTHIHHDYLLVSRNTNYLSTRPILLKELPHLVVSEEILAAIKLLPTFKVQEEFIFSYACIPL